jgi:galacturan 1,4-alpha-galacturonidase
MVTMTLSKIFLLAFSFFSLFFFTYTEGRVHAKSRSKHSDIVSHVSLPPAPAPASPSYYKDSPSPSPSPSPIQSIARVYNVLSFGAVGDGVTDDTQAFKMAWDTACLQNESAILLAPDDYSFMIEPTIFTGPCKTSLVFQVISVK